MDVIHKRILEPSIGDIVYQKMPRGNYVKVQITDGYFLDKKYSRLSNFWKWKVIETGEFQEGYGNFYEIIDEAKEAIEAIEGHYRALTNILLNNKRHTVIIQLTWNEVKELRSICKLAYNQLTGEDLKEIIREEDQTNDN